jgi:hypothetical protein
MGVWASRTTTGAGSEGSMRLERSNVPWPSASYDGTIDINSSSPIKLDPRMKRRVRSRGAETAAAAEVVDTVEGDGGAGDAPTVAPQPSGLAITDAKLSSN